MGFVKAEVCIVRFIAVYVVSFLRYSYGQYCASVTTPHTNVRHAHGYCTGTCMLTTTLLLVGCKIVPIVDFPYHHLELNKGKELNASIC